MAHFDSGRLFARLMDRAGYSALVPGNHGLTYGIDTLRARQQEVRFPFVAANLVDADSLKPVLTPFVIVNKGDVRVLVTGVLSTRTKRVINPATTKGIDIIDPRTAIAELLESHQRGRDFDYTVALTHMRPLEALQLAQSAWPRSTVCCASMTAGRRQAHGQTVAGDGRQFETTQPHQPHDSARCVDPGSEIEFWPVAGTGSFQRGGNALNSKAKIFLRATESRKVSLQQFNFLVVNISGGLHITVDGNLFYHWDNQVRKSALKSELQVGLGYVWDGKWVR